MKPVNPSLGNASTQRGQLRQAQSVYKALDGAIAEAQPLGQDSTGVYNQFEQDNGAGVMLRIGGSASTEPIKWVTADVGVVINHGLQRQPIGFRVFDKDASCDVYRTVPPDTNTITLACTLATANVTVYIF